jgi:hypothetical protein
MIVTELYNGQGFGNQLACYVTTRVIAKDKNCDFGIMNPYKFKGKDFMNIDMGLSVNNGIGPEGGPPTKLPDGIEYYFREWWETKRLTNGSNIMLDDPGLDVIKDNTKIDGVLQSENKIIHRKNEIKEWLKVNSDKENYNFCDDDTCILAFRGGEYVPVRDFFLRKEYWIDSVNHMLKINPNFKFVVVTDDPETAKQFFPKTFYVTHSELWNDYTIIKNAKYLISSNSSFPYFATLTSDTLKYILAPKYWARHNISDGYWSCGYNIYRGYNYVDREGNLFSYDECVTEFEEYKKRSNIYENI